MRWASAHAGKLGTRRWRHGPLRRPCLPSAVRQTAARLPISYKPAPLRKHECKVVGTQLALELLYRCAAADRPSSQRQRAVRSNTHSPSTIGSTVKVRLATTSSIRFTRSSSAKGSNSL